jgi:hypothetical protein
MIIEHGFHVRGVGNDIRLFSLMPGPQDVEFLQVMGQIALVRIVGGQAGPNASAPACRTWLSKCFILIVLIMRTNYTRQPLPDEGTTCPNSGRGHAPEEGTPASTQKEVA